MLGFCEETSQGDDVGLHLSIRIRMVVVVVCYHFEYRFGNMKNSSNGSERTKECSCDSEVEKGPETVLGGRYLLIILLYKESSPN